MNRWTLSRDNGDETWAITDGVESLPIRDATDAEFAVALAEHDRDVRESTIREAMTAMIPDGAYADHNRAEAEGDYVGQAYHEGMHDAWSALSALLPQPADVHHEEDHHG